MRGAKFPPAFAPPSLHIIRRPVPPPACCLCIITCPALPLALQHISTRAGAEGDATDKGCRDATHKRAGNGIGDKGAEALAEALKHNSTLKELYLQGEGRLFSACLCTPYFPSHQKTRPSTCLLPVHQLPAPPAHPT